MVCYVLTLKNKTLYSISFDGGYPAFLKKEDAEAQKYVIETNDAKYVSEKGGLRVVRMSGPRNTLEQLGLRVVEGYNSNEER